MRQRVAGWLRGAADRLSPPPVERPKPKFDVEMVVENRRRKLQRFAGRFDTVPMVMRVPRVRGQLSFGGENEKVTDEGIEYGFIRLVKATYREIVE